MKRVPKRGDAVPSGKSDGSVMVCLKPRGRGLETPVYLRTLPDGRFETVECFGYAGAERIVAHL